MSVLHVIVDRSPDRELGLRVGGQALNIRFVSITVPGTILLHSDLGEFL